MGDWSVGIQATLHLHTIDHGEKVGLPEVGAVWQLGTMDAAGSHHLTAK